MKKTLRFLMLFAIGLFLALSVTSCGDDDDDDTNSSNPSNNGQQGGSNPDSNVTPNPDDKGTNSEPAKTFTVTFHTDGGNEVVAQNVEEGKTATKPEEPTKEGFDFEGWFNGESLYDFSTTVTSDLTLTAKWKIKTFTVTFNTDGGSEVSSQVVGYGNSVTAPEKPSKDGFYFLGWYVGENVYDFAQPIYNDESMTAMWMEKNENGVDLGLPSGTLWATCNVGAENPWDYGDYFAWGETRPKAVYSRDTYTYGDNPATLDAQHDAAMVNVGSNWRMPTKEEFQELLDYCEIEWTSNYQGTGVAGRIVWGMYSHSTHIFLPASGYRIYGGHNIAGFDGNYWSSTRNASDNAWGIYFDSDVVYQKFLSRVCGQSVRPVRCK
jgi:uncharacterized repeat protein (TIGR02543 family)/uncharacterized protein (TIGR02145 family)